MRYVYMRHSKHIPSDRATLHNVSLLNQSTLWKYLVRFTYTLKVLLWFIKQKTIRTLYTYNGMKTSRVSAEHNAVLFVFVFASAEGNNYTAHRDPRCAFAICCRDAPAHTWAAAGAAYSSRTRMRRFRLFFLYRKSETGSELWHRRTVEVGRLTHE